MTEVKNKEVVWAIDPVHTKIRFDTKYLLLTQVSGWFTQFEGAVVTKGDGFDGSRLEVTIYPSSIYTGNEERDAHLRSADFFDVDKYPVIVFTSDIVKVTGEEVVVTGMLKIKDVEQPLDLKAQYVGMVPDNMGNLKAGFVLEAVFNRKDFHITWNQFIDKKGLVLSDEVSLRCDVQLLKIN